jgi:hypothetical protein
MFLTLVLGYHLGYDQRKQDHEHHEKAKARYQKRVATTKRGWDKEYGE